MLNYVSNVGNRFHFRALRERLINCEFVGTNFAIVRSEHVNGEESQGQKQARPCSTSTVTHNVVLPTGQIILPEAHTKSHTIFSLDQAYASIKALISRVKQFNPFRTIACFIISKTLLYIRELLFIGTRKKRHVPRHLACCTLRHYVCLLLRGTNRLSLPRTLKDCHWQLWYIDMVAVVWV